MHHLDGPVAGGARPPVPASDNADLPGADRPSADFARAEPGAATLLARCDQLGGCSDETDRLTRSFLSPALEEAMTVVAGWMQEAGLETERDGAGNLIGSYCCGQADAPVLVLGSHLDTVRDAGRYDGALGVLLAVATAERTVAGAAPPAAPKLPFDLDVVAFADEEGLRFGAPFLGSKAFAGSLEDSVLDLRDTEDVSLREALARWSGAPVTLPLPYRYQDRRMLGYVEAHIEQGPVLEQQNLSLGILEAIAASCWLRLSLTGAAGHAGTTPMSLRHDPLPAAAEIVLAAERLARDDGEMVATVGRLEALPGAGNVIAGHVELSLDMRHADISRLEKAVESMLERCRQIAARRGLGFEAETLHFEPGVHAAPQLSARLERAARASGIETMPLVIGAGHDALVMARRMPVSMLLLRCPGGLSHHPDEKVLAGDVEDALCCLHGFVAGLAADLRLQDIDPAPEILPRGRAASAENRHGAGR